MIRSRAGRAARNTIGSAALHLGPLTRKVSGMLSGIGIRYPAPAGAHRSVGQRAPDVLLTGDAKGPARLYEALRTGDFVLLTPPGSDLPVPEGWANRVRRATVAAATDTIRLVRPDGYIAWASRKANADELAAALIQWCGAPRHRPRNLDTAPTRLSDSAVG